MAAAHWRDPVAPCFSASDAAVAVVVVLTERATAAGRGGRALARRARLVKILERPAGQQFAPFQRPPTALGPVANTDTTLLIYGLFQKGRVLAQDDRRFGVGARVLTPCD